MQQENDFLINITTPLYEPCATLGGCCLKGNIPFYTDGITPLEVKQNICEVLFYPGDIKFS